MRVVTLAAVAALLAACGEGLEYTTYTGPEEEADMQKVDVLTTRGLWTGPNPLVLPEGALLTADNLVVDTPNQLDTRPGFELAGGASFPSPDANPNPPTAWVDFNGVVVAWGRGVLARYDSGTNAWVAYAGTYPAPPGLTLQDGTVLPENVSMEVAASSLYVTTATGPVRLDSPTGTPVAAGVPVALEGSAALTGASGWLPDAFTTAYRYVWGTKTATGDVTQERTLLGPPSGRLVVANTAGASRNVINTIPIPPWATEEYFVQVYRATAVPQPVPPGDDMRQVDEAVPTAADLTAGSLQRTDVQPDGAGYGPALYTSPSLGDGALAAREPPPMARHVVETNGYTVWVAPRDVQRFSLNLLSVGGEGGISQFEGLYFYVNGLALETYTAQLAENPAAGNFLLYTFGTPAENIEETARSLCRVINARANGLFWATYASADGDPPGLITLAARSVVGDQIAIYAKGSNGHWLPALRSDMTGVSLNRTGGVVAISFLFSPDLKVGQTFELIANANTALFPLGTKTVTAVGPMSIQYVEAGADGTAANPRILTAEPEVYAARDELKHGFRVSGILQPDSVPLSNEYVAGNRKGAILAVQALDKSVYFLKEDGLYRVVLDGANFPFVETVDTTLRFIAPRAVCAFDGAAYALTDQGLVRWTESSRPEPADGPINFALRELIRRTPAATMRSAASCTALESQRRLLLSLPDPDSGVSYATQAYVLNVNGGGVWTRWTTPTTAAFTDSTGRLWRSVPTTGATERNRAAGTNADFQDSAGEAIQSRVRWAPQMLGAPDTGKLWHLVTFSFRSTPPSAIAATFATELVPAESTIPLTVQAAGVPKIETMLDTEHARGSQLTIGLTHAVAQERLQLLGYSVRARLYSGRR